MESLTPQISNTTKEKAHYSPPWKDVSIIGVAGSSGSGKTSLAVEIVKRLDLPWVVILSMDSFYKTLSPEENALAHQNMWDLDSPDSIDFDILVERLKDLKEGRVAEIPIYSFAKHQRQKETTSIYSPHVLILEGILALQDPRVLDLLDMKIFVEADLDVCLSRRIIRDVRERGRTIEGIIEQWFRYVKPSFQHYVEPQRLIADIIVPRGVKNEVAIDMVVKHIQLTLSSKSKLHRKKLQELGEVDEPLPANIYVTESTPQITGIRTILQDPETEQVNFIFYFDRLAAILIEKAMDYIPYTSATVTTPNSTTYNGLVPRGGPVSACALLRGGSCLETALKRTIPDCITSRILIQTNYRTGEPELHYLKLPKDVGTHSSVILMDTQMSSGGAALMAVRVLVDHGVKEENIVFVTFCAGEKGLGRLGRVFPGVKVIVGWTEQEGLGRWIESRYFGA